jgi:hypothetical protein
MAHPFIVPTSMDRHPPPPTRSATALWNNLDPHRRRLFAQRLALLIRRRQTLPYLTEKVVPHES